MKRIATLLLLLVTVLMAGCGSGAGGNKVTDTPQPQPAGTAVLELSTRSDSNVSVIYALATTIVLPAGVTVSVDPETGEISTGALQLKSPGALAAAKYTPATATSKAQVTINVINASGFPIGAFGTLTCQLAAGATYDSAGFTQQDFSARDSNGAAIPSVSGQLALLTQ